MTENANKLKALKKTKGSMKAKLTQFDTYFKTASSYASLSDVHANELSCRLSRIEDMFGEFDTLQNEIEMIADSPEEQYEERRQFEDQYYKLVSMAKTLLSTLSDKAGAAHRDSGSVTGSDEVSIGGTCRHNKFHLPKINIPKFNGSYQHWLEFRDTFSSMIHNNQDIDKISKFHYLRASLQESASDIIKNIDFTQDNYTTAWNLLNNRYNNPRLLVNNHVQALFNISNISQESSSSIRSLIDVTNKNIRALSALKQPTQYWDTLIIYMVSNKLDPVSSRDWEEYRNTLIDPPTLEQFCTFLNNKADLLETLEENKIKTLAPIYTKSKSFVVVSNENNKKNTFSIKCSLCKGDHLLYNCDKFRTLSIEDRISKANGLKVCLNCLRPGHTPNKCRLSHCRYCKYKHNTLLHLEKQATAAKSTPTSENVALQITPTEDTTLCTHITQNTTAPYILLSTALVKAYDSKGKSHNARILLDNASTANFITSDFCSKLGLPRQGASSMVSGICNQACNSSQSCNLMIKSLYSDYQVNLDCLILPQITKSPPSKSINVSHVSIPTCVQLADPTFNLSSTIDILVGAEIFWSVLCGNSIDLGKKQPKLYETKLGWLVSGYVCQPKLSTQHHCHFINQEDNLNRFWELDSINSKHCLTSEERACEESFNANTYRNHEGRFVVKMPLKRNPNELGDSYVIAKSRFVSLERRFQRDPIYKQKYLEFMQEYESLGHMTANSSSQPASDCYYLPHHGVIRESSTTTKLRSVFDASATTTTGLSLNDLQMVGPTVQDDLLSILIRFRQNKYVISGDIEKMYRAIEIHPSQRCLQQIIFRSDTTQALKTYTLNTLTYGTASAPYLATKCLTSLAECAKDKKVSESIKRDFYIDDYMGSGPSKDEVIRLCKGVMSILSSAKFNLRKFRSNDPDIVKAVTGNEPQSNILKFAENDNTPSKTLGLYWMCKSDKLSSSINIHLNKKITKRNILSAISQIFDPLGLVGPVVMEAKIIMQKLWLSKVDWDDDIPDPLKQLWLSFSNKLSHLNTLEIPRWVLQDNWQNLELHTFSDASELAYGSCIYARSIDNHGNSHTQLIASKNKVAPIKPTTMPRLELCAALLGARLCSKVLSSITLRANCRFWSDSTIVLGWLTTPVHKLKPFIRNRVNEINDTTAGSPWGYVPSQDNPADIVSRGVKADLISTSSLWWSGPTFLHHDQSSWPKMPNHTEKPCLPEIVSHLTYTSSTDINYISKLIHKHSNFTRLIHSVAYVHRFITNCKTKQSKLTGVLSHTEIHNALIIILKQCQYEMFPEEYILLKSGKSLPAKNRLLSLSPFLDSNDIIRVGGRLDNSPYTYEQKHPALLCSKHHITKIIFYSQHIKLLHTGPLSLLASIRQTYWPLGGRNLAKQTVNKCVVCFRHKPKTPQPIMGQLPTSRTMLEFPFLNCSVDYAGPLLIANKKGRGCKLIKSYLCIFVCLAVKAVHLELVTELSTEAYLAALRRFISRRGKPLSITSDNGTNFVGACNEIQSLISNSNVVTKLADEGINFRFSPAYSPHFNGMAEAAVRSAKFHLKRILTLTHLTYEEMSTCLTQIEAILNSRPLTPLSTDPSDMAALTPSHFLIGRTLTSMPHPQMSEKIDINQLQRYKRVELMKQHFWNRFTNDYISTLQQKTKWQKGRNELMPNTLVIIKDKTIPPLLWSIGRIIRVYPGVDGINRVAEIKTKKGTIRRGWNNICTLPLIDNP